MTAATWTDGEPNNLEAAAEDAYKWLAYIQTRSKQTGMTTDDWDRLYRCMEALRGFMTPNAPGKPPAATEMNQGDKV